MDRGRRGLFQHPGPIHLFDDNGMKPSGEAGEKLVLRGLSNIGDASKELCELGSCLFCILRYK
ncbi:hypothetical protein A7K93_06340 [Candidatus Methylacidiphilum fumarolicum]|nr:hypothetical protein A7K73_09110 [Candidatus Methylacidiphilum fumarolicum]TFE73321.1 hypothetical protein A7K93_06340 [Candidatus Methylacidiphilum fumarolicum]TFE74102.1 hypothetical protein A7K72_04630 [Candidatus Methylacidiphilum fumarolicum]TFE77048.1 hypothetical protein A7D33_06995 [Candidatus Methylacidiphilum fumarolicum]